MNCLTELILYMQKIFYFIHVLCLLFALKTTAADRAATTTLLETGLLDNAVTTVASLANASDDALSADFGEVSNSVDMLEIAEIDIDKILLPGFSYPLHKTQFHPPEHQSSSYHLLLSFWLDRPPQSV